MIYCPECGTANRDGSRFCNECGEKLGTQTRTKCPQCGTLNPVQNVFCAECGERLLSPPVPAPGAEAGPTIKGLSLPTKSSLGDGEGEPPETAEAGIEEVVPTWLQESGATPSTEPEASQPVSDEDAAEIPDWLQDLRAALPEEPEAEIPQSAKDEQSPDWLAALRPSAEAEGPEPASAVPEAEESESPDWLAELRPSAPPAEPEPEPSVPEAEEGEVPDWLAELRPSAPPAEPEPEPSVPEAEEGEVPDWRAELRPSAPSEEPEPTLPVPEAEEGEVPDWLAELQPSAPSEEPVPILPVPEAKEGEVPDWLAELQPSAPSEEPEPVPPVPEAEEAKVPDWLAEVQPSAPSEEPEPILPIPEAEEVEVPNWLAELPPSPESLPATPDAQEPSEAPTMPVWLAAMTPTAPEEAGLVDEALTEAELPDWLVPAEAGLEEGELLEKAEIPDWLLALKPRELRAEPEEGKVPAPATEETVEETGLLAGLQGTLPVEMLIAQPRAAAAKELEVSQAVDTPQARLFAEIVARPPSVAPKIIIQPRAHQLTRLPRLIIYFALIAAVAFPLLLGESLLPRAIDPSPAVVDLYDSIEALDSDAPVLMAFDYDPATAGEMDVVAQAIASHLADQKARLVAVSLFPAGPATAQRLLEETAAEGQYANLGYMPGQAAAVRLLGQSLETASPLDYQGTPLTDLAVMDGVTSLQDFDLVIELAATQNTLRWWIEQGGQPYGIPMGAGVSASVEPFARPYYETESRQLVGLVSGVPGAAMYDTRHSGQDSPADILGVRLDALLAGNIVFVLVLLIGNGVYLFQRKSEEER